MNTETILNLRLANQGLVDFHFKSPKEVVGWFGAVQSQDFPSAKWAIGQRIPNSTSSQIEDAYNKGEILRTHILRPTWHFVSPDDIVWMQSLTSHRVKQLMKYYNRTLGLTDEIFEKSQKIIETSLKGNNYKTRTEISEILEKNGIHAKGQRLGHLVFWPELNAVICSGPMRGKKFTYALVSERAPKAKDKPHDEGLEELTKRYFQSHGPAMVKDFSWWSGLTTEDCKKGIEMNRPKLILEKVDGKDYWMFERSSQIAENRVFLLPNYDEYGIAYKDRDVFFDKKFISFLGIRGNANFQHMIVCDGKIIGTWKRILQKNQIIIEYKFFKKPNPLLTESFKQAIKEYARFVNTPTTIKEY